MSNICYIENSEWLFLFNVSLLLFWFLFCLCIKIDIVRGVKRYVTIYRTQQQEQPAGLLRFCVFIYCVRLFLLFCHDLLIISTNNSQVHENKVLFSSVKDFCTFGLPVRKTNKFSFQYYSARAEYAVFYA